MTASAFERKVEDVEDTFRDHGNLRKCPEQGRAAEARCRLPGLFLSLSCRSVAPGAWFRRFNDFLEGKSKHSHLFIFDQKTDVINEARAGSGLR